MPDQDPESDKKAGETARETLLREIREDFTYFRDYWRDNHEEMKIDLRFAAGDPWDPEDRRQREENGRPVLCPDELDQYLNQAINNLRQNKRAIKVNPKGSGANDKDAERRGTIIRGIEYRSNAQAAYTNAFEGAINCGLGFFRITTEVISDKGEVQPCIKIIENPLTSLPDPDAKEADFSDAKRWFLLDTIRKSEFARRYPKATKRSFTPEDESIAADWFNGDNIIVAEYWRIDGYDQYGKNGKVTQYITNGLEILEENEWPGSWIPIIIATGKRVLIPKGGSMKRMYYSMIRKARGPQMMLAYIGSQEAEEYGMAPRAPAIGYVGQFETDKTSWDNSNKVPHNYLQVDPIVDAASGQLLPLPQRNPFTPNAAAYEVGFERWRRSVQAAMGISPLPTAAQRQNEKSGVALDKIQTAQAVGSFHFTDNFDRALENAGRQLDELITKVMDTPRQIGVRNPDESHSLMHVAPGGQGAPADADPEDVFDPTKGEFDVTISTGPSFQSQREEASQFVDLLVQNLKNLPLQPPQLAALLAKAIKLKNVGPIGEEIAQIIDPQQDEQDIPPQAQQAISQLQQQMQQLNAACQHYEQKIQELEFEKKAKVLDNEQKLAIEKIKIEAQIAMAEITTKAQNVQERVEFIADMVQKLMDQSHEAQMTAAQQQHEQGLQQGQQAHEGEMQQADQAHQQELAQQQAESAQAQQLTQIAADQQSQAQDGSAQ
jgi:hypothetical protein